MAKIRRGATITGPLTVSLLHSLVDGATIEGIAPADIDPNYCLIRLGAVPASPTDTPLYIAGNRLYLYNGSGWQQIGCDITTAWMYNESGGTIPQYGVVIANPSATYPKAIGTTTTGGSGVDGDKRVIGVTFAAIANASWGVVVTSGLWPVLIYNSPASNDIWVKSDVNAGYGYAEAWGANDGYFAQRIGAKTSSDYAWCVITSGVMCT